MFSLAEYLQARNPNTPGIINKLMMPPKRDLAHATKFWLEVRRRLAAKGRADEVMDIYSGRPLHGALSIDHFLPWSFVAHDQFWNLLPVERSTNSSKGDSVPDLKAYLVPCVRVHHAAFGVLDDQPWFLHDYCEFFQADVATIRSLNEPAWAIRYQEVFRPLSEIAVNQGFPGAWRFRRSSSPINEAE